MCVFVWFEPTLWASAKAQDLKTNVTTEYAAVQRAHFLSRSVEFPTCSYTKTEVQRETSIKHIRQTECSSLISSSWLRWGGLI